MTSFMVYIMVGIMVKVMIMVYIMVGVRIKVMIMVRHRVSKIIKDPK